MSEEALIQHLLSLPAQEIYKICSSDLRFPQVCQGDNLWYRLIQRDLPCQNLLGLQNPREFYFQSLAAQRQLIRFPLAWNVDKDFHENLEANLLSPGDLALLNQPIHGLCHLVLYYPIEDYSEQGASQENSFYRVEYNFNHPVTLMNILELITRFYHQPFSRVFANAIRRPDDQISPRSKVYKLLGERRFIRGLYPHGNGYILLID